MTKRLFNRNEPVCKFGPGGDFSTLWPVDGHFSQQPTGRLFRLLRIITEIINTVLGSEFDTAPPVVSHQLKQHRPRQMLFADDWRVVSRAGGKATHRIRAYRRAGRKSSAHILPAESLLFDTELKAAKTA